MDFVHDVLSNETQVRMFTPVEIRPRDCIARGAATFAGSNVANIRTTLRRAARGSG